MGVQPCCRAKARGLRSTATHVEALPSMSRQFWPAEVLVAAERQSMLLAGYAKMAGLSGWRYLAWLFQGSWRLCAATKSLWGESHYVGCAPWPPISLSQAHL